MAIPTKTEVGKKIIEVIIKRLKTMTIANGYDFDLKEVLLNAETADLDDLPSACVFSGNIFLEQANGCNMKWKRAVLVDLLIKVDPRGDGSESECAFDEVYRALFGPEDGRAFKGGEQLLEGNATLFRLDQALIAKREDGNRVMGISLALEIDYVTRLTNV